jgi:cysteine desulfurase/selenocysteine lyase
MQAGKPLSKIRDYSRRTDLGARAWDVSCTANFFDFMPWTAAIEYLLQAGPRSVASHDQCLVAQLLQNLDEDRFELVSPRIEPQRSALIVMRSRVPQQTGIWQERLSAAGFDVAVREGNLRISPHLHNSPEDISRLITVLSN